MIPDYDRGPWWWRLRCALAERLAGWSERIEPGDRTSVSWLEGDLIYIDTARRREG